MIGSVDLEQGAFDELRTQLRIEQYASWIAGIGVVLMAAAVGETWGIVLGVMVGVGALVRLPAFGAVARRNVTAAIWWVAAGTWGIALCVIAVVPPAFPIMILNLIAPLITGAVYLDPPAMKPLIVVGVGVAIVMGTIGYRADGTGLEEAVPDWVFQVVMIVFLAAHVIVLSSLVNVANRVRLAAFTEVLSTNEALTQADSELRASRRRVITAGDEERIRLERNIHDGAQQRLVALAVQLKLAAQLTRSGTPPTAEQFDHLHDESREAIAELRELARGIYPSVLTERGLEHALRSVADRSPNDVTVDYDPTVFLSPNDSAAIYFVCLEALQNIAKHGGPSVAARLRLGRETGVGNDEPQLIVEISDHGPGFDRDSVGPSRGLLNMADRAGALGGELVVESSLGAGTRITMVLPDRATASASA